MHITDIKFSSGNVFDMLNILPAIRFTNPLLTNASLFMGPMSGTGVRDSNPIKLGRFYYRPS